MTARDPVDKLMTPIYVSSQYLKNSWRCYL